MKSKLEYTVLQNIENKDANQAGDCRYINDNLLPKVNDLINELNEKPDENQENKILQIAEKLQEILYLLKPKNKQLLSFWFNNDALVADNSGLVNREIAHKLKEAYCSVLLTYFKKILYELKKTKVDPYNLPDKYQEIVQLIPVTQNITYDADSLLDPSNNIISIINITKEEIDKKINTHQEDIDNKIKMTKKKMV